LGAAVKNACPEAPDGLTSGTRRGTLTTVAGQAFEAAASVDLTDREIDAASEFAMVPYFG